jgi:predicted RND superfamily exporter protein
MTHHRRDIIEDLLQGVGLLARRRYRRLFWLFGALVVIAAIGAARIRFDTEVLNLLPEDDPVVEAFREALEEFGSLDYLLVAVRIPEGAVVDPYLELADELAPRLEALEEVEYVDHSIGDLESLVREFFPQAFLFLDEEGRRAVEERLSAESIQRRARELHQHLTSPESLALRELLLIDPLGLAEVFMDRLMGSRGGLPIDLSRGYFLSRDRRLLLLLVKPTHPAQEIDFARALIASSETVIAETLSSWPDLAGEDGPPPPEIELGGTAAITVEDAGLLTREILSNAVVSLVLVLLLFLVAFRRLGLLVYAFLPLGCGLLFAFGFAGFAVGKLNALTSGFAAILVGLGIDFVIVSYGRYAEERNRGQRLSTALRRMCGSAGRGMFTAAATTAAAFYVFLITEFQGLRQMGFLIGTGVLFCFFSVLLLLPSLLAWREDRRQRRLAAAPASPAAPARAATLFFHGFGAHRLIGWSYRHPVPVLVVGAVVTAAAAWSATRIEFVDSIRSMRPEGTRGMVVQDEVVERFGSGFDYMMLVITSSSEEQVLARTAEVTRHAKGLVDGGILRGVDSISSVLAPPERQREVLAWLEELRSGLLAPGRVERLFADAAQSAGLRADPFAPGLDLLRQAAATREAVTLHSLAGGDRAQRLLQRYVRQVDGAWKSVVYLHPPPRVWKRTAPPEVEALDRELGPDVVFTGTNRISERLRNQVKADARVAAGLGGIAVALLLWIDYRRLSDTLLSLAPLSVGIVWMLGGMSALGFDMNFFNVFVTSMIIGIGIDYGVHMVHRYHELHGHELDRIRDGEARGRRREAVAVGLGETGKAVVLAALSTCVGFGSLATSHYPGLRSMGFVAILGALATALTATTLLPAILGLRFRAASAAVAAGRARAEGRSASP